MRINSIEIKNYRQYIDQKFDFTKNSTYDMHIIIASNGVGKTNFLNAITWCLYNDESHLGIESKSLPILNIDVIKSMSEGDESEINVIVNFSSDGKKMIAHRTVKAIKRDDLPAKIYLYPASYELTIIDEYDSSVLPSILNDRVASEYMNRFLPEGINEYFFFDNEQLDSYFINNESETIKTAIIELSQVELLLKSKRHLDEVIYEYQIIVKKNNPNLEILQNELDNAKERFDSFERVLEELKKQISISKKKILDNKVILKGAPNIKEIEEELDEINRQLEENKQETNESIKNIREFIRKYSIILRMYPELKKTFEIIEDQEKQGNLPMDISLEILKEMIENKVCKFCDTKLSSESMKKISDMIEKIKFTNQTASLLIGIKSEIIRILNEAKDYPKEKNTVWKKHKELCDRKGELETLKIIKRDTIASRADSKLLKNYIIENEKHESLIKDNEENFLITKQRLIKSSEKVEEAKENYNKALKKSDKNIETKKLLEFSQKGSKILEEAYNELIEEMKDTITKRTFDTFSQLIWKEKTYKEVKIDDSFNLDLIHTDGYSCIGSCSAAERALLALSFTLSLHKISGFDVPLVIDSPVGRVSDTNRENFGKVLNDVCKGKQIIMLFTPSEYSEEVKPLFEQNASNIYIVSSVDERATQIRGGNINV